MEISKLILQDGVPRPRRSQFFEKRFWGRGLASDILTAWGAWIVGDVCNCGWCPFFWCFCGLKPQMRLSIWWCQATSFEWLKVNYFVMKQLNSLKAEKAKLWNIDFRISLLSWFKRSNHYNIHKHEITHNMRQSHKYNNLMAQHHATSREPKYK